MMSHCDPVGLLPNSLDQIQGTGSGTAEAHSVQPLKSSVSAVKPQKACRFLVELSSHQCVARYRHTRASTFTHSLRGCFNVGLSIQGNILTPSIRNALSLNMEERPSIESSCSRMLTKPEELLTPPHVLFKAVS